MVVSCAFSFFCPPGPRLYRRYARYGPPINNQFQHRFYSWIPCGMVYIYIIYIYSFAKIRILHFFFLFLFSFHLSRIIVTFHRDNSSLSLREFQFSIMRTRLRSYLCTFDIADAISESIISNFLPYPTKYKILQFDNFLIDS